MRAVRLGRKLKLPQDNTHQIGVNDIIAKNGISDPNTLKPGQRLALPSGHCLYR